MMMFSVIMIAVASIEVRAHVEYVVLYVRVTNDPPQCMFDMSADQSASGRERERFGRDSEGFNSGIRGQGGPLAAVFESEF